MDDVGEGDLVETGSAFVANLDRLTVPARAQDELGADQLAGAAHRLIPGGLRVGQLEPLVFLKPAAFAGEVEIIMGHGWRNALTC